MFLKHPMIAPGRVSDLLRAAEAAARAIPPAFPLSATVAVNPFLGQIEEDFSIAAARMARVAGTRITRSRAAYDFDVKAGTITDDDLSAALAAHASPLKPVGLSALKSQLSQERPAPLALRTVAELAAEAQGTDWPSVISRSFGLWAAGHFDRGQALWSPAPGQGAFASWREWAIHDLTPEIAGLTGFCSHVAQAPDTPERALLRAAERLGITEEAAETAFALEHQRFALLPTFLHQDATRALPTYGGEYFSANAVDPQPGSITIRLWAEAQQIWQVNALERVQALADELLWSADELARRFAYRDQPWLYVVALRIYRLPTPLVISDHPSYAGCRSWIPLQTGVAISGSCPVLDEATYASRLAGIERMLTS